MSTVAPGTGWEEHREDRNAERVIFLTGGGTSGSNAGPGGGGGGASSPTGDAARKRLKEFITKLQALMKQAFEEDGEIYFGARKEEAARAFEELVTDLEAFVEIEKGLDRIAAVDLIPEGLSGDQLSLKLDLFEDAVKEFQNIRNSSLAERALNRIRKALKKPLDLAEPVVDSVLDVLGIKGPVKELLTVLEKAVGNSLE